jgi:hypothetical protein
MVYPATGWKNNCTENKLMGPGIFVRALKKIFAFTFGYQPEF